MRAFHLIALCGILMVACSTAPTAILEPTATPAPTLPPPTATPEVWKTYVNDERGFSFEYPAVYDEPPYGCGPKEDESGGLTVGYRIYISIQAKPEADIAAAADEFVADVERVEQRVNAQVGGENALTVDYRFGGTGRFGTVTFVHHAERLWVFNWTAGGFCDPEGLAPEGKIFEGEVYAHLLGTFQFR